MMPVRVDSPMKKYLVLAGVFALLTAFIAVAYQYSQADARTTGEGTKAQDARATQDRLASVQFFNLFRKGPTEITRVAADSLGELPSGCSFYKNLAFTIKTQAVTSGPYTTEFSLPSVNDPAVFAKLRIFYQRDFAVEPLKTIWVDRTILPSDKLAPSFENKTIYASSDYLGTFAVVLLNESQAAGT